MDVVCNAGCPTRGRRWTDAGKKPAELGRVGFELDKDTKVVDSHSATVDRPQRRGEGGDMVVVRVAVRKENYY